VIVSCEEMRRIEERAFSAGSTTEGLMENAGAGIARAVRQFFPRAGRARVFFGKGHNGGDALVAARHLQEAGWAIELAPAFPADDWAELTRRKHAEFSAVRIFPVATGMRSPLVALDGLLGIGGSGRLREPIRSAVAEINRLRRHENAHVFAIDLPTGLNGDSGEADAEAVRADFTLAIGCCKTGLVADAATPFVGRIAVLPVAGLSASGDGDSIGTPLTLAQLQPRREFDTHKTEYGRVAIVAGSMGLTGAAILAAEGALRAGAGLVRLFVTRDIHAIVAASIAPEVMVQPVDSLATALETKSDVIAIGPGLGEQHRDETLRLIEQASQPMVVDADGLNILSGKLDVLERAAAPRLLTPHPGEMSRLMNTKGQSRSEIARAFIAKHPVTLLLKGSRTIVAAPGRNLSYNSTGNPGMGTGGMGDVLTGVCAALLARKQSAFDAARIGAWVCGRAAEIAVFEAGESEESLVAGDVIRHLGRAFDDLRAGAL
jgi:hydroxyethylthiazole kinase-like uncharacterized protein yjeF